MEILLLLIGCGLGCLICYFVLQPKVKATSKLNEEIDKQNKQLEVKNEELKILSVDLSHKKVEQETILNEILKNKEMVNAELSQLKERLVEVDKSTQEIYDKSYQLMQERLAAAADKLSQEYQELEEKCKQDYLSLLEENGEEFAEMAAARRATVKETEQELATLRAKVNAAIEAAKREEEKQLELDKYKILITELDLTEINRLREIAPYFRNERPIRKIIWEGYYRTPTNDLINRVVGTGVHTGIYKITNLKNQKVYVGQSLNISDRFKQHIRCGVGIDTPNNILYKAMLENGVENFTFEVLEECERTQLNEREKYYIAFYKAQEFGYNMSQGGA